MALWERAPALEVVRTDGTDDEYQLIERETFSELLVEYVPTGNSLDVINSDVCDYCKKSAAAASASA